MDETTGASAASRLLAVVLAILMTGCGSASEGRDDQSSMAVADSAVAATLEEFGDRHGAVTAWDGLDAVSSWEERLLTIDLQERWISSSRPVLFTAELLDVVADSLGHLAVFGPPLLDLAPPVYLRVRVSVEELEDLRAEAPAFLDRHVLVVMVDDVRRPVFALQTEGFPGEFGAPELEPGTHSFIVVSGELLEARLVRSFGEGVVGGAGEE